jgi:hypothetical protein
VAIDVNEQWKTWQAARQSAGATGQEPVGEIREIAGLTQVILKASVRLPDRTKLYAAPIGDNGAAQPAGSKRVDLTDDEILDVFVQTKGETQKEYMVNVARALLARASAKGE